MTDRKEMAAALEAILFVSSEPVPRAKLLEVFDEKDRQEVGEVLDEVRGDLASAIDETAGVLGP